MKRSMLLLLAGSFFLVAGSLVCAAVDAAAADHDFNSVVAGVEHQYSAHAQRVPLMGLVSLCARLKTHGGVNGMRIAEFDHLHSAEPVDLAALLQTQLGDQWQPFVAEREKGDGEVSGDQSIIFVRPEGSSMRMMIADYSHGELDLVRMELHGDALAKWIHDPETQGQSSNHGNPAGD